MREYGQVQSAFWQSPDAQSWSDTGKLLALYLLTGPHANGIGCYRLPDGYVMADLGWSAERVSKGFQELSEKGFADRIDGVVFLPNFLRWNKVANGNIAKARLGEFESLPKGDAKALVARALLEFCGHWDGQQRNLLETVTETLSEGYANQNPTIPNPTKPISPSPATAERFEEFWLAYPSEKRVGRKAAEAKWRTRKLEPLADKIIADVKARAERHRPWLDGFAPNPETYLNGSRWEDAFEAPRRIAGKGIAAADDAFAVAR